MRISNVEEHVSRVPSTVIYVASNWKTILFWTIVISLGSIVAPRKTNVISTIDLRDEFL